MEDVAFSQTLKKLSLKGAAVSPRRRPSRRSSPRRWLLIFELVQNFHNTVTRGYAESAGSTSGREERRANEKRKDEERYSEKGKERVMQR